MELTERKQLALIRTLETEKENYIKTEKVARKETELQVNSIKNNATEILENAKAQNKILIENAKIEADETLQTAHNTGKFYFNKERTVLSMILIILI